MPRLAVSLQSQVFVTAVAVAARPGPDLEPLGVASPTSSFPSGHTGTSRAFHLTLAMLSQRVTHPPGAG